METYNGWTNYETWNVNLWLTNDEGSYSMVREMAVRCADTETSRADLADELKALVEEMMPDLGASMYADLLGAAISSVNWHELAEHYLTDLDE